MSEIYYYFAKETERLNYNDNRKIVLGKTHTVKGIPKLCTWGLHASKHPFDALKHAPGPILYVVQLSGQVVHGDDKSVATRRKYIKKINATGLLWSFARWCALQVVHLWDCPDIVKQFLETGDESLRDAARAAAWAAAWATAGDAARAAAWAAAWATAGDAVRDAARDAAWATAGDAVRDAARDAARDKQKSKFIEMVQEAFESNNE